MSTPPTGQQAISEIPVDRLFYPADLRDKRVADIESAEAQRLANLPPIKDIDTGDYKPGLRMQRPRDVEPAAILREDLWHDPEVAMPVTDSLPDK